MMMSTIQTLEVPGYQVVQFLGSGAASTIWQVRDRGDNREFALKRVLRRHASDYRFLEQAINEYEVGSELDHPVVRRIYRIRRVKRWLRLVEVQLLMELCEGSTVQSLFTRGASQGNSGDPPSSHAAGYRLPWEGPPFIAEVVRIFLQVGDAMAYMNSRGIVHADMKPNNILVGPGGSVKIIDLGQSCPIGTVKQRIQGTPDYIAPEQVHRRPLDARTDVFNFGASLYWTLTGKAIPTFLPKKGGYQVLTDLSISPPESLNPAVPVSLGKLVIDCLKISSSQRPANMGDVVARMKLIRDALGLT
jgi:serine/threonine-protein kinase